MKKTELAVALSLSLVGSIGLAEQLEKPNVLLIVADDLGYSDISPFGGEIPTPNLQVLADEGVKFSQYYTAPMSAPARSMILSGNTNHEAGMGSMWWYDSTVGQEGYELQLTDRVMTLPEVFKDNGYETIMSGKWHLGFRNGASPKEQGFNRSFAFVGGGTSHFADVIPLGREEEFHTFYTLDGEKFTPPDDFYSTTFYAQKMNEWIKETPKSQPIFAYLAFTAPHDPIQAPDEWIEKFKDQYQEGYAPIYDARMKALVDQNFLAKGVAIPDLALVDKWSQLSAEEQKIESRKMQVYAAMVAYMDDQIGGVIKTLKETGRYDNTIIIFLSDNGANPGGRELYDNEDYWAKLKVDDRYESIGKKGSFTAVGANWTDVNNAPFQTLHKTTTAQGGINTNFILSAPMLNPDLKGTVNHHYIAAYDLAPTLYALTDVTPPPLNGRLAQRGISHKANLVDGKDEDLRTTFGIELHNQSAFIDGDWKIRRLSSTYPKATMGDWVLFNIKNDPLETQDLAVQELEILQRLVKQYTDYANNTLIIEASGEYIPHDK